MGLSSLRKWRNLVGTKHSCCLGKSSSFGQAQKSGVVVARASGSLPRRPELAPVEPSSSWTRMEVDDGQRDEQDESADQPEELRRVLAARQPTELEVQKHSHTNHAVFAPWCEVCVKAKGTGAQHRRQTNKELAQYGPRIYSDVFYMSEEGVSTPMLALRFSRSGRMAATALEQKGLTQYGVTGCIQQIGVRMFINKSDGEPARKALMRQQRP